ncbi:MAG: cysteine desulfurase [Clostridia bacterium]|nr:cysteine desulfurase [Clostridia bacterium]
MLIYCKIKRIFYEKVYLDNAATTVCSHDVLNEMLPAFNAVFGNPSSLHSFGREASNLVDRARDKVAHAINAKSEEIYFTAGGSEANNWAIKGLAHANMAKGKHIITTKIEHDSVLESCQALEHEGFTVTYVGVDETGLVSLADILHNIRKDTILISVMTVNNEVGTIQNIKAIAKTAHENGILFHTDAVAALGSVRLDVEDMEIDAMSMSAHKIYGPKGCGALYLKNGVKCQDLIDGGNQERKKRGGTHNVPAIVGFGRAIEIATKEIIVNQQKIKKIRDYFVKELTQKINYTKINGHAFQKVQGIVNIGFEMINNEALVTMLDLSGVAVSVGSACTSGVAKKSHVLTAMNVPDEYLKGSIRFSFGKHISKEDIDYAIEVICQSVAKLRAISPITKTGRAK